MNLADRRNQFLIAQLRNGKEQAFDTIYDLYWKPLFQYAYKRSKSEDVAKDLVQDVFISLWNKKDVLELTSSLTAYLFSILRFKLIDYYYASEVRKHQSLSIDHLNHPSLSHSDERTHVNEINHILNQSILKLPCRMQQVFELSRIKGYTTRQISEHLCISERTVKNQLSAALKRLKTVFKDYLGMLIIFLLIK